MQAGLRRIQNFAGIEVAGPVVAALLLGLLLLLVFAPQASRSQSGDSDVIRIYTSVPMNSFNSIVHGVEMAIEEAGRRAGDFRIELVALNGGPEIDAKWTAEVELANARQAVEDPDAMVYIGTYNSGAAKVSIPVLNRVNMAMISPGNTYPGLTKPGSGDAGEPWNYYPLGTRNYFRVVPADDLQGSAAAAYAREIGMSSVFVLHDTELYGNGVARIFADSAAQFGIAVLGGPEGIDVRASSYADLVDRIIAADPDLVYFGGISANNPGTIFQQLRFNGYTGAFMGADGIADTMFAQQAGFDANGQVYATLVGLPASRLSGDGAMWYSRYRSRYYNDDNEDFAPFGYEAARVALHAIATVNRKDRDAIRAEIARTTSADLPEPHILGDWQFDANGDTSLVNISVLNLTNDSFQPWRYSGLMVFDPQSRNWEFQEADNPVSRSNGE